MVRGASFNSVDAVGDMKMDKNRAGEQDRVAPRKAAPADCSKNRSEVEKADRWMQDALEDDDVREALGLCQQGRAI